MSAPGKGGACGRCGSPLEADGPRTCATCEPTTRPRLRRESPVPRLIDGRYRLGRLLGTGGFGRVHEAHDLRLGRLVALKLFHDAPDGRDLRKEARVLARLHHPHVVTIFDLVEDGERYGLAMELVLGGSLAAELRNGRLEWRRAATIACDVAAGLQHAHESRVIHADVKPSNVLLDADGRVKVSDFGTARLLESMSSDGSGFGGTLVYASPEVIDGARPTALSDVYSLGCVIFECLAGRPPRRHASDDGIRAAGLPEELVRLVTRCLSRDPAARPSSCGELHLALMALTADRPATVTVPPELRADLRPSSASGERRRLIVLIAARRHLDALEDQAGSDEVRVSVAREDEAIMHEARRHGGLIVSLTRDEARITFGVAGRGEHDVHEARACALAILAMRPATDLVRPRWGLGIHLVLAVAASPSQPWSLQAGGIAEASSLARAAADGELLISRDAAESCRGKYALEPRGTLSMGGGRSIEALRLEDERAAHADAPLVGRTHELGILLTAAEDVAAGTALIITVAGPPGIGKSRLLSEAARGMAERGLAYIGAEAQPPRLQQPHHPLRELLADAARKGLDRPALDELTAADRAVLDGISRHQGVVTPAASEREFDASVRVAMRRWVAAVSRRHPLAIFVEDVHLLDGAALEILWGLVDGTEARVLVAVSARPGHRAPWMDSPFHRFVSLPPLSRRHVRELTDAVLGAGHAELTEVLASRAEGNPLLAIELSRAAAGRGSEAADAAAPWPASIQAAIAERLDRLPADARLLLQIGATMGREFELTIAERALELEGAHDAAFLAAEPVKEQLIDLAWRDSQRVARFHHALMRDTVCEHLTGKRRRELHETVARALAADPAAVGPVYDDRMAEHLEGAGLTDKAIEHLELAARRLSEAGLGRAALRRRVHALELREAQPRQRDDLTEALIATAQLQIDLGDHAAGDANASRALAAARQAPGDGLLARALGMACDASRACQRLDEAVRLADEGLSAARRLGDVRLAAELLVHRSRACAVLGRVEEALADLAEAEREDGARAGRDIATQRTRLLYNTGRHAEALDLIDARLAEARARGDMRETVRLLAQRCPTLVALGRLDEAGDVGLLALAEARKAGIRTTESYCLSLLAHLALQSHEPLKAEALAAEALILATELGSRTEAVVAMLTRTQSLHDLGRLADAKSLGSRTLDAMRAAGLKRPEAGVLLALSRVENTLGRWYDAESRAREALDLAVAQRDALREQEARSLLSEALRGQGRVAEAREAFSASSGEHDLVVNERVRLLLAEGRVEDARAAVACCGNKAGTAPFLLLRALVAPLPGPERRELASEAQALADARGLRDMALEASSLLGEDLETRILAMAQGLAPRDADVFRERVSHLAR